MLKKSVNEVQIALKGCSDPTTCCSIFRSLPSLSPSYMSYYSFYWHYAYQYFSK